MKYAILLIFLLAFLNGSSQDKEQELLVKNNITKRIIQAYEYKNNSIVKETYHVEDIDAFGNTIAYKTYDLNDSLVKETKYKFSDDGTTKYGESLDKEGELRYSTVTIKNKKNRSIRNLQINTKGDTLIEQLWIKDHKLNDSVLYNVRNGKRFVYRKWNYNDGYMLVSRERFDKDGDLTISEAFTYQKRGNCIKRKNRINKTVLHKCREENKVIWKILQDNVGYRAGIKLGYEKGGERIETKLENGLLEKIELFSKKGKLLALIKYTYVNN